MIIDFKTFPRWVSYGLDEELDDTSEGLGPDNDMFPINRNVTFIFDCEQGAR